jgi:hypothetical protein
VYWRLGSDSHVTEPEPSTRMNLYSKEVPAGMATVADQVDPEPVNGIAELVSQLPSCAIDPTTLTVCSENIVLLLAFSRSVESACLRCCTALLGSPSLEPPRGGREMRIDSCSCTYHARINSHRFIEVHSASLTSSSCCWSGSRRGRRSCCRGGRCACGRGGSRSWVATP